MDSLYSLDEETALLIIQLQIEDKKALSVKSTEGSHEESLSDSELAFEVYQQDLELNASMVADKKMTRRLARACQTDGQMLATSQDQEQAAARDRDMALQIHNGWQGAIPSRTMHNAATSERLDDEAIIKLEAQYIGHAESGNPDSQSIVKTVTGEIELAAEFSTRVATDFFKDQEAQCVAESSTMAAARSSSTEQYPQCIACNESSPFYDLARVPCGHEYCRECIQTLFQNSMTDDPLFPPRCCRETIPFGEVRLFLSIETVEDYEAKKIEFETPNRTYCANPLCSAFIRAESIVNDQATCPECSKVTCAMCKASEHTGDCPADEGLRLVLAAATENGWKRCYNCRHLVELEFGCNHMTSVFLFQGVPLIYRTLADHS
jgi:hypothetical protein